MGLFGKSKKERETEYMSRLDVPSCLKEDFELIVDKVSAWLGAYFPIRLLAMALVHFYPLSQNG